MNPSYLLNRGYDVSLLELPRPASQAPVPMAGSGEGTLWAPGELQTIAGWGRTEEGSGLTDVHQEAQDPIATDAYCNGAYPELEARTMIWAGYPEGGVETC